MGKSIFVLTALLFLAVPHLAQAYYDPVAGHWLSFDPMPNDMDPNGQSYCGGNPIKYMDPNGLYGKAAGQGLAEGLDFTWNLGVVTFLTPSPENATPQQQSALTQIALNTFGSPLERVGLYGYTPNNIALTQQLPASLGGAMQNTLTTYGAQPGVSPVEINVSEPPGYTPETGYYIAPNGTDVPITGPVTGIPIVVNAETIQAALQNSTMQTVQSTVSIPAIQRYVQMLENGQIPPPISVDNGVIVDGNHRYVAGAVYGQTPEQIPGTLAPSQASQIQPIKNITLDPVDYGNR